MSDGDLESGTPETVCPRCAVGCSLRYDESIGRATGVDDAPVNQDGRLCPKGISAYDGLDEGRLTEPRSRIDGELVATSWEAAYDRIEEAFAEILARDGAQALAFLGAPRCTNEENYLFAKLARVLGTNTVDNRARSCHSATVSAMAERLGSRGMTNSLADLVEADAFLVAGANPAAQQPIAFNSYVRAALKDGASLVHVDPRANRTTRAADVHLAPRPGTDGLLVTLLAAAVLEAGLVDWTFVDERTTGFERYVDGLRDLDVEALASRTGVDPGRLREAARTFAGPERAAVLTGTGIEGDEVTAPDALLNLVLLTGNVGRRGTGMNPLRGLVNEQGANDVGCRPTTLPGYRDVTDSTKRSRVASVWGTEPPATPGRTELEAVRAFGDEISGAFVLGENPAVSKLDDDLLDDRFDALDFLLVQDVSDSETVARSDVVLPASGWAEKRGTVTNLDRQVQLVRPARSPPGDARRDRRILQKLGARVTDESGAFEYEHPEEVFQEMTTVNPLYAGMSYDGIADGGQRWPFPEGATGGTQVLHANSFANGSRRAPFDPTTLDAVGSGSATHGDGNALRLVTRNQVNESGPSGGSGRSSPDAGSPGGVEGRCWMHTTDARSHGIDDGERVLLAGPDEEIVAEAHVTTDVRDGTVFLDADAANTLAGGGTDTVRVTTESP